MRRPILKLLVFGLALVPFGSLAWRLYNNANLGINPRDAPTRDRHLDAAISHRTLAVTLLRRITGWNPVIQHRRMLGLFAFFYGTLHFFSYLALDQVFSLDGMLADVSKRPFIAAGFVSFIVMVPLAVTSAKGWIRRLGRRWQMLHRLIYLSAAAGAVHYLWKAKVATASPVYYAVIVGALLAFRIVWSVRKSHRV